jgi:hypothetical protein
MFDLKPPEESETKPTNDIEIVTDIRWKAFAQVNVVPARQEISRCKKKQRTDDKYLCQQ